MTVIIDNLLQGWHQGHEEQAGHQVRLAGAILQASLIIGADGGSTCG